MGKRLKYRPAYRSVQAWQEATGTNNARLAKMLGCTESHLSNVLKKSRRCSLKLALDLSRIANVPVENICEWPPEYEEAVS
jgi:antitoxin component HigA of HigAB toxin-antitoxin module